MQIHDIMFTIRTHHHSHKTPHAMQYKGNAEALSQIMVIFNRYVNNNTYFYTDKRVVYLWGNGA